MDDYQKEQPKRDTQEVSSVINTAKEVTTALNVNGLVDAWHEDEDTTLELHEYLGMTWEEYVQWVRNGAK